MMRQGINGLKADQQEAFLAARGAETAGQSARRAAANNNQSSNTNPIVGGGGGAAITQTVTLTPTVGSGVANSGKIRVVATMTTTDTTAGELVTYDLLSDLSATPVATAQATSSVAPGRSNVTLQFTFSGLALAVQRTFTMRATPAAGTVTAPALNAVISAQELPT